MVGNNRLGVLKIRKRPVQDWLVMVFFFLPFLLAFATEILNLPSFIKYLLDILLVALTAVLIIRKRFVITAKLRPLAIMLSLFLAYALIGYLFNFQSPFYLMWGLRNTFRFYLAFFVFTMYLCEEDGHNWLGFLDVIFWVDIAVAVFQFFVIKTHQDLLGGIFGVSSNSNGYTIVFFCIVVAKSLISAFNGTEKYRYCLLKCLAALLVAAMAEIKFFYFVFALILVVAAFITEFSKKKLMLILSLVGGLFLFASLLSFWYEEFEGFFSVKTLWEFATKSNYSSSKDLNRLSAVSTLTTRYITDPLDRLFGMGIGNCDMSEIAIFNSRFYQNYGFLHYYWFAFAMVFLELGFVGLALYLGFFVACIIACAIYMKRKMANRFFCQMGIVIAVVCIAISFYSSALRVESGYMAFFVLALPFINAEKAEAHIE